MAVCHLGSDDLRSILTHLGLYRIQPVVLPNERLQLQSVPGRRRELFSLEVQPLLVCVVLRQSNDLGRLGDGEVEGVAWSLWAVQVEPDFGGARLCLEMRRGDGSPVCCTDSLIFGGQKPPGLIGSMMLASLREDGRLNILVVEFTPDVMRSTLSTNDEPSSDLVLQDSADEAFPLRFIVVASSCATLRIRAWSQQASGERTLAPPPLRSDGFNNMSLEDRALLDR